VTHGAAQVHQPTLRQQDDVAPVSQRVPSQEHSVAVSECLSDPGSEFSIPDSESGSAPKKLSIYSVADPGPGSGAFITPGSGMGKKSGSGSGRSKNQDPEPGSGMNNPYHISESSETVFWDKYPGSVTLVFLTQKNCFQALGNMIRDIHPGSRS
jgi:hypothetical protein